MVGSLLILSVIVAIIATAFFLLGNTSYQGKGLFFATLSILLSFVLFTILRLPFPYPWVALVVGNAIFYLALWFPVASKKK